MDLHQRMNEALEEHLTVIQQLTAASSLIVQVASELVATLRRQGKVVLCGNGGSASDAQHIAAEMQGIRAHPGTPQGLLALVLTENTALFTAISNDVGYPTAFRHQVEAIVQSNDLVIGLSTSGRSPSAQGVYGGLRAADVVQRSEADQSGHDEVDGDKVVEKTWKNQNENPHDECHKG
jgi:D-sedoheptulose 7-phosphate isomerase